ncbi:MAG: BON domain-containing protein [Isosphaeraceae bacterium]|nr:BON domain-containing protein [Isosphaeraceae bacterium]
MPSTPAGLAILDGHSPSSVAHHSVSPMNEHTSCADAGAVIFGFGSEGTSEIAERARVRLRSSPYLSVRSVACVADEAGVRLTGRLPSYYLKQIAQEAAFSVAGETPVFNEVVVERVHRPLGAALVWDDAGRDLPLPDLALRADRRRRELTTAYDR